VEDRREALQLRAPLLRPMLNQGIDGTGETLEFMGAYSLGKDDFDAIMEMQILSGANAKADIAQVPSVVKAALTRKYNQANANAVKKVSGAGAKVAKERFTEDAEDDASDDENEDEDGEGAEAQQKPSAPSKGKGKANKAARK